jgi:predicted PurR-regulated permease PerM
VDVEQLLTRASSALQEGAGDVLSGLVGTVAGVGEGVVDVALALMVSVYLLVDGPRFVDGSLRIVPSRERGRAVVLKDNATRVFGGYLRSQLALALIVGVAAAIGSAALGLPYALLLGVLAGLFELVPVVGSTLSAVPALLVALSMPFPKLLWVLLYFVILQQVEDHILAPRMSGQAVGLHPLAAMFALLAGVQVAGVVGGLLAVPVAGLVWALLRGSLERGTE